MISQCFHNLNEWTWSWKLWLLWWGLSKDFFLCVWNICTWFCVCGCSFHCTAVALILDLLDVCSVPFFSTVSLLVGSLPDFNLSLKERFCLIAISNWIIEYISDVLDHCIISAKLRSCKTCHSNQIQWPEEVSCVNGTAVSLFTCWETSGKPAACSWSMWGTGLPCSDVLTSISLGIQLSGWAGQPAVLECFAQDSVGAQCHRPYAIAVLNNLLSFTCLYHISNWECKASKLVWKLIY